MSKFSPSPFDSFPMELGEQTVIWSYQFFLENSEIQPVSRLGLENLLNSFAKELQTVRFNHPNPRNPTKSTEEQASNSMTTMLYEVAGSTRSSNTFYQDDFMHLDFLNHSFLQREI